MFAGCSKEKEAQIVHSTTIIYVDTVVAPPGAVVDLEGNVYSTTSIGSRRWMADNLKATRYSNGDPIPFAASNLQWTGTSSGAWCIYGSQAGYDVFHGKLYNWYAASDARNVCPSGWHVPTDIDWQELESAIGVPASNLNGTGSRGAMANAGGQLKALVMWDNPNIGATDSLEFTALPGGTRFTDGNFGQNGAKGFWWTQSESDDAYAWQRSLANNNAGVYRFPAAKSIGASIRCVED